jgi:uncharacterized protein YndB with AHSA1/START domain
MEVNQQNETKVERKSDLELVVTHTLDAPARLVWEAWTKPELFRQWWVPKSFGVTLLSCEIDARVGGGYRLTFANGDAEPMAFFGRYLEVTPPTRLVWTNEEGDEGQTVTTVTFSEVDGKTVLAVSNLYPSKEALEADGSTAALPESLDQLDELLAGMGAK